MFIAVEITPEDKKNGQKHSIMAAPVCLAVRRCLDALGRQETVILSYNDLGSLYLLEKTVGHRYQLPNPVEMFNIDFDKGKNPKCLKFELEIV